METLAHRLRKLRKDKNLSAKDVAQELGVAISTYREWEYGRLIKGEPYAKLAEIYGVSVSELITGKKISPVNLLDQLEHIQDQLRLFKKDLSSFF
jgi:transcriptional regulator with XRE-family HTH domain